MFPPTPCVDSLYLHKPLLYNSLYFFILFYFLLFILTSLHNNNYNCKKQDWLEISFAQKTFSLPNKLCKICQFLHKKFKKMLYIQFIEAHFSWGCYLKNSCQIPVLILNVAILKNYENNCIFVLLFCAVIFPLLICILLWIYTSLHIFCVFTNVLIVNVIGAFF